MLSFLQTTDKHTLLDLHFYKIAFSGLKFYLSFEAHKIYKPVEEGSCSVACPLPLIVNCRRLIPRTNKQRNFCVIRLVLKRSKLSTFFFLRLWNSSCAVQTKEVRKIADSSKLWSRNQLEKDRSNVLTNIWQAIHLAAIPGKGQRWHI